MCGIAGIVGSRLPKVKIQHRLTGMREILSHRGPDGVGLFMDEGASSGFVHTRLAILDLSSTGHQPMQIASGRYTIVFNGEIYNFHELRDELIGQGVQFHSISDTEVLLQLYMKYGPTMVGRLAGMFAFAIWDRDDGRLFLARDPLGIKPLYVWRVGKTLAFASEIRAVLAADIGPRKVDAAALTQYLMFGSVQEPQTLVENILMLPAGHTLTWKDGEISTSKYWELTYPRDQSDPASCIESTRTALDESIRRHFVSDVPVGIFLSGGIDSTALVALAKSNGYDQLKTFNISFGEEEFNEGNDAARTAEHFGTDHHEWRMTSEDGRALFKEFLDSIDQPSNDGFNTYCVSKFARDAGLKVVLSGLGGDEMFGGYPTFSKVPQLIRWHRRLGPLMRPIAQAALRMRFGMISERNANRLSAFLRSEGGPLPAYWTMRAFFTPSEAYKLVDYFTGESLACSGVDPFATSLPTCATVSDTTGYLETTRYMRNQLLRDSDVFSMAHGLELRVPLVDRRLLEAVHRVPSAIRHRAGKQMFLDAVPEIPYWVANAPKRGFRFPFEKWVADHWKGTFDQLERSSPVRLETWYRKWTFFTLQHFLETNGLSDCVLQTSN